MLAELGQEYVTTARIKGLSEWRVVWRHALGNIMVPLVTVMALAYANLLEGSVLTETVFAWPGLGQYITQLPAQRRHERGARRHHRGRRPCSSGSTCCPTCSTGCSTRAPDEPAGQLAGAPWLLRRDAAVAAPGAARPGATSAGSPSGGNPLAMVGLAVLVALVLIALCAPLLDRPHRRCAQDLAGRLAAARRRRTGSAPTSSAATSTRASLYGSRITLAIVGAGVVMVAPDRPRRRHGRGLSRRLGRHRADAGHRRLPRLSAPRSRARLRRRARPGHRERGDRHRAHRVAALRAHRPGGDPDHPPTATSSRRSASRAPSPSRIVLRPRRAALHCPR